ncbi:MAG: NlpC/P60 family protein [Gammaproteobacteria bacterium]|nr:NlpC/P60 family protein [Gammaproteobacteria bacterium]
MLQLVFLLILACLNGSAYAEQYLSRAITQPIPISSLKKYSSYPVEVQHLISKALSLSQKKLTYLYGSANPNNNGMDCSGTINYLLNSVKIPNVPRQANEMYTWAENKGHLYHVNKQDFHSREFSKLKPGDLLFWTGTYAVHRYPAITHVMIYLGENNKNQPLMFGASDGRRYEGKSMRGVSVFDFELPRDNSAAKFVGYSCIPHLTC